MSHGMISHVTQDNVLSHVTPRMSHVALWDES